MTPWMSCRLTLADVAVCEEYLVAAGAFACGRRRRRRPPGPLCIAIAGAQGSGKTTLAEVLTEQLVLAGVSAVACSLDDFYLTRAGRIELARSVHPLLITRGVPGTHDVRVMHANDRQRDAHADGDAEVRQRSRRPRRSQCVADGRRCRRGRSSKVGVSARGRSRLTTSLRRSTISNATKIVDGRWRRYVNDALARYRSLFARFDRLVFLRVPDFDAVRRWRAEQELQRPRDRRMRAPQLRRFIAHYERLTLWMLEDLPGRADLTVLLDDGSRDRDVDH